MTNVSKKKLSNQQQQQLKSQFVDLLAAVDQDSSRCFFNELFSEAEQIMLMKRLAIILLLQEGYSKYRIAQTLQVSESTVLEQAKQVELGRYRGLLKLSKAKTFDAQKFLDVLETLLQAGLPPQGKGRWKKALRNSS